MNDGSVFPITRAASDSSPISRSLFGRPTKTSYKLAVSKVIRDVKSAHNLTNIGLAEVLGCDEKTIRSAESGDNGALDAVTLLNIAYAFGESAIAAVRNLYLCAAQEPETKDEKIKRLLRELQQATEAA